MNFIQAMNEVYTWNQLTRPSWGPLEFVTRGAMEVEQPNFADNELHGTTFEEYTGNVCHKDMETRQPYVPSVEDQESDDWEYWFHPESKEAPRVD